LFKEETRLFIAWTLLTLWLVFVNYELFNISRKSILKLFICTSLN
jgi:hypothetical protein